ncbi:MAG: M23 family metallopeptidase [Leptospiraceae bacterium]|nr:M23 family metallopeptidase [Leptospiraceae bacterium]
MKEFGSNELEFREINKFRDGEPLYANRPLFFPYGEEYANSLISQGKGRDIIIADVRDFIWPVSSSKSSISSKFGNRSVNFHAGIDIQCPMKSPVVASYDGVVVESGFSGNYGLMVRIKHELNQLNTLYAHNSTVFVKTGEKVKKGQIIALSGSTGHSTGPHLHFEVRYQNIILNPEHFILPPSHTATEKFIVQKEENL